MHTQPAGRKLTSQNHAEMTELSSYLTQGNPQVRMWPNAPCTEFEGIWRTWKEICSRQFAVWGRYPNYRVQKAKGRDESFQFFCPIHLENASFSASAILSHSMELSPAMQGLWHASAEVTLFFQETKQLEKTISIPLSLICKEISECPPRNKMLNLFNKICKWYKGQLEEECGFASLRWTWGDVGGWGLLSLPRHGNQSLFNVKWVILGPNLDSTLLSENFEPYNECYVLLYFFAELCCHPFTELR